MNHKLILIGIFLSFIPEMLNLNDALDYNAKIVLGMTILMVFFWVSEAIPNSITALVPIIVSPCLIDLSINEILSKYASPVVFLLLGGFILANGFEKSNLHQRLALKSIIAFGSTKKKLLFCCIFSTAFFSMWLSNTATCLLMLPIVKFLVDSSMNKPDDESFAKILILSIAYASSIGGMMTPIGTIPNAVLVSFLNENYNYNIDFIEWFILVSPLAILILAVLWFFFSFKINDKNKINQKQIIEKYKKLGKLSSKEIVTSFILFLAAFLWIFKSKLNSHIVLSITDSSIAIACGLLFFVIPCNKRFDVLLNWEWFKGIPWNVLILFGGGLSMAGLIVNTGLAKDLSELLSFIKNYEVLLIIFCLTLFTSIMTEFTSNTATTFLFLPIFASFAIEANINIALLTLPIVLAASCAFMMPISTPPNAIVYSSNKFNIKFMVKTGIFLNIISVIFVTFYINFFSFSIFKF